MDAPVVEDLRTAAARFNRDLDILTSSASELIGLFHPETGAAPARGSASAEAKGRGKEILVGVVETSRAALRDIDALLARYRRVA